MLSLIVAASDNHAIGFNGQLLWHLPNDLRYFKNTTWAMPVVMGRKTFDSVGKPLQGRTNIVITSRPSTLPDGVVAAKDLTEALEHAAALCTEEVFIIGGGQIYEQTLPMADRIYMTRVHTIVAPADTYFPIIDEQVWQRTFNKEVEKDEKNAFDLSFEIWEKRS